ncbi:3-oxoacyl-[acyl-carrier protein] reductase/2-hydroxycyclohexanecarboxyl-CoA dehydrogenase [Caldalkalibacillus uzonensis]|uniref:3-oxoacyl-[acyl-carrier protein] reductase/2-hydroxycyclohexanecarboxyl-CoA dehydrogenase n=1 Tax=Caldalkalibacillus uzonensis TaxID=353224 RepID=A0ABU0CLS0_9BACI|nr:3-oxoacyl-ACP reductase FabG [Caldalkalibacillus uzonensis]MDQ0337361.1 3-oxoacyl-[acyl-carrier protein] reductase/2-hydroxycyclohexanecarboxyl-CoA dehydrogenase [Caldalkalibacillus uzonensis]
MITLNGKVAIVTGAARGLGKGIAEKLASLGAYVVVSDVNKEGAQDTVTDIKQNGGRAEAFLCNVANVDEARELIHSTVRKHGHLDILINNAGINRDAMLHKMTQDQWSEVIAVNLNGVFNTMQPASVIMREQEYGRIVNISSASWLGNIGQANYAAAKAGVVGITKTAARELAKKNITVNAICPGFIDTDMTRGVPEKVWEMMISKIPMGRAGKPEDVANCIAFLVSDHASYITGEVINVGGGMVL